MHGINGAARIDSDIIRDYAASGYHVFPLYQINQGGECGCGNPNCKMAGKHPAVKQWQHTPAWSEEQLDNMIEHSITTGYGVLCAGFLVVDVDPRNGGDKSYKKLCADLGLDLKSDTFWVSTGGGGWHVYFKGVSGAYLGHLDDYPGIDFKTTGYVVGCGSLHSSGATYERGSGFPEDTAPAPSALLELIKRPEYVRAVVDGSTVDMSVAELQTILNMYPNDDLHYDDWIAVGMALHHTTGGGDDGYNLWLRWSATSKKHQTALMQNRWHSFGKSPNPITLGTLIHKSGYILPVTFDVPSGAKPAGLPCDISHVDLARPPGFVGEVAGWIRDQCYYPRERLASSAALMAIANLAGLHWRCDVSGATTNMLMLCVAGSGTGKEAIQQAFFDIMRAGGMAATVHGDLKSKQEIIRNLIEHQAANYLTDEIGEILKTIESAKRKGGAAYLEGITGEILKIFTKADGVLPVSGDVRRDLLNDLIRRQAQAMKKADETGNDLARQEAERLEAFANKIRAGGGLPQPFFSLLGFTTIDSLQPALSVEMAKNGFLNRAFIIEERNNNPKPNPSMYKRPFTMEHMLHRITTTGHADTIPARIEHNGEYRQTDTTADAKRLLNDLQQWQWEYAEEHCEHTGYESLARRAWEMICKVSATLAIADAGVRTVEHVTWAAAWVKHDIDEKIRLIRYVDNHESDSARIQQRIISLAQEPVYVSWVVKQISRYTGEPDAVNKVIDFLSANGILEKNGKKIVVSTT
jgi:hypothetical protein